MKKAAGGGGRRRQAGVGASLHGADPDRRYDANIDLILRAAAAVFAEKSFGSASIRAVAARAQISFPRIYYYLRNKDELLYLISKRAFEQLLRSAGEVIAGAADPEARLRLFINNHLEYQMNNLAEMKVLAREADALSDDYAADIARLRREYWRLCRRIVEELAARNGKTLDREQGRIITSLLFGAMSGFYTWDDPAPNHTQRTRIMDEVYRTFASAIAAR